MEWFQKIINTFQTIVKNFVKTFIVLDTQQNLDFLILLTQTVFPKLRILAKVCVNHLLY